MHFRGASATIRPALQHVTAQGYTVTLAAGSSHWRVQDAAGAFRCALPHTPSSRSAAACANSVLRLAGIEPMPPARAKPKRTGGAGERSIERHLPRTARPEPTAGANKRSINAPFSP